MKRFGFPLVLVGLTVSLQACIINTGGSGGSGGGGNTTSPISRNRWGLVRFGNDMRTASGFNNQPTLNLMNVGNGDGYTGCRPIRFSYSAGALSNYVSFRNVQFANYEPCRDGRTEDRFISTLKRANRYQLNGDQLVLLHGSQELAVFTAK